MAHIYIVNPKGGCGKTTVAAQLACYFIRQGCSVLMVDHDQQRSCSDWVKSRLETLPEIPVWDENTYDRQVSQLSFDYVIHDTPAAWTLEQMATTLVAGDKMLIPVLPSSTDVKACLRFVMGLYRSDLMERSIDIAIMANRVRKNTTSYSVLLEFLQRIEVPYLSSLRDTQNYVNATSRGLTVFDQPESRVADDLLQWAPIVRWASSKNTRIKNSERRVQEIS